MSSTARADRCPDWRPAQLEARRDSAVHAWRQGRYQQYDGKAGIRSDNQQRPMSKSSNRSPDAAQTAHERPMFASAGGRRCHHLQRQDHHAKAKMILPLWPARSSSLTGTRYAATINNGRAMRISGRRTEPSRWCRHRPQASRQARRRVIKPCETNDDASSAVAFELCSKPSLRRLQRNCALGGRRCAARLDAGLRYTRSTRFAQCCVPQPPQGNGGQKV